VSQAGYGSGHLTKFVKNFAIYNVSYFNLGRAKPHGDGTAYNANDRVGVPPLVTIARRVF